MRLKDRLKQSPWRSTLLDSDPELDAPPSYLDSTSDAPPPYAEVDVRKLLDDVESIITASFTRSLPPSPPRPEPRIRHPKDPIKPMNTPSIDFDDTSSFRQAKKNKAGGGKAQKQANKNSWGSDDEGNKDAGGGEGDGASGDGGNNAAGGAGGDGGDGGDGGGGDEWNDWNAPSKKKKAKKGKGGVDEEEEKKKKEEEEMEKEQEEAANPDPLSWANTGNPSQDDDWGGFTSTTKKGKKGKKDKVLHSFLSQRSLADILA